MGTYILDKKRVVDFILPVEEYNVLVRVTNPEDEFLQLKNHHIYKDILELYFFDFADERSGLHVFQKFHLEKLLAFFKKHHMAQNMVIHCDQGLSRSAGIAVGWFLFNDNRHSVYKLYHDDRHMPNRLVVEYFYRHFKLDIRQIDRWEKERYERLMNNMKRNE